MSDHASGVTQDGNLVWSEPATCPGCGQPAVFRNGETAARRVNTTWNERTGELVEHTETWWHESCAPDPSSRPHQD